MNTINIRRDDILWRFYCKKFTIDGKEIEPPKNLCRYFWTSVSGFGLWLGREVKLRRLWLISLVATAVFFVVARVITDTDNIMISTTLFLVGTIWFLMLATTMMVTMSHFDRLIRKSPAWVMTTIVVCSLVLGIWFVGIDVFLDSLWFAGYILVLLVAVVLFALALGLISRGRWQRLYNLWEILSAVVSAKKNRVCPPVNPPDDFKFSP